MITKEIVDAFRSYGFSLLSLVPFYVFAILIIVFVVGCLFFLSSKGLRKGSVYTSRLILIGYIFLIYCVTVFFRAVKVVQRVELSPFWSYSEKNRNHAELLEENFMNVMVFIPIGALLGIGFSRLQWWKIILIGFALSVVIELLQLVFKRGCCEFDDVMHNTLGCLIGYGMFCLFRLCKKHII